MPYHIQKRGDKFCVVKKTTNESKGCSDTREEAEKHMAALYANEPKVAVARIVTLAAYRGYSTRYEMLDGRKHLVLPVVALVEGVVHAMNSEDAELVTAAEFKRAPSGWNGRPIFHGHPLVNGRPVSGNSPTVLQSLRIGTVFNTGIKNDKLAMEAWIDEALAQQRAPELLSRIESGEGIEISVGTFVETEESKGRFNGKDYAAKWQNITPDHLAILPEGQVGACSREMGCGIRAAKEQTVENMYSDWLEPGDETDVIVKALRNIPQSERDKMDKADFAGPNESFPIQKPEDVANAARAIGRAKGNKDAIKAKIISIAKRKGASFVAQLPDDWKPKSAQKNAQGFIGRMLDMFRSASTMTSDVSDTDIRMELREALVSVEPRLFDIIAVYDDRVVYSCYEEGYGACYYQRAYSGDEDYTLGDRVEVEPVMSYEPVDGADDAEPTDMADCGCGCGGHGDCQKTAWGAEPTVAESEKTSWGAKLVDAIGNGNNQYKHDAQTAAKATVTAKAASSYANSKNTELAHMAAADANQAASDAHAAAAKSAPKGKQAGHAAQAKALNKTAVAHQNKSGNSDYSSSTDDNDVPGYRGKRFKS